MSTYPDILTQCKKSPEWAAETIIEWNERVHTLESQINKNSQNSSKPPSLDGFKKLKPKSLRPKTGKLQGGQKGHQGKTLYQVEEPDDMETHKVCHCHQCGKSLEDVPTRYEKRQVFDIPPMVIRITEHRGEVKSCPFCETENRAPFPDGIKAPVQYGPHLKALGVYLHDYQLLPYARTRELLEDLLNQPVSQATLVKAECEVYQKLESVEEGIVNHLLSSPVVHFDETGLEVNGKKQWIHVASSTSLTHYTVHKKRGKEGMDAGGVLPNFDGVAVHDAWKSYFKYGCEHALCHAHHLREWTGIYEQEGQQWAKEMIDLLLEMKKTVDDQRILEAGTLLSFVQRYDHLIEQGLSEDERSHPPEFPTKPKRGRKKQSPAKNMLDRLQEYRSAALGFIRYPYIPFDNNQAERDVRMVKVQQKISGTFRDSKGAERFCRVRGYISTMKKQSHAVLEALHSVITGEPILPSKK